MLVKLALRQSRRQLKTNVFHLFTLTIIFMVLFVMASFTFDKTLTDNLTSNITSNLLNQIGGMGSVFHIFLWVTVGVNLFFLTYIYRIRLRQNSKLYALYRLMGMRSRDLFILYFMETGIFTIVSTLLGGALGFVFIRMSKIGLLMLGSFVETKVNFTFSFISYGIAAFIYGMCMLIVVLCSFFVVARTDIILLFKQEHLVQKISKLTPCYLVLGIISLAILPCFAQISNDVNHFFINFGASVIISVFCMYFLYKSAITMIFLLRRKFGFHKRHGSEFITGRFFFSQLNRSATMMTIISVFLIGIFLFSFLSQILIRPENLEQSYGNDFSMDNATQRDQSEVKAFLEKQKIQYFSTELEYTQIVVDRKENNRIMSSLEIQQHLEMTKTNREEFNEFYMNERYQSYFIFTESVYQRNLEQMKKVNKKQVEALNRIYHLQEKSEVKQIGGTIITPEEARILNVKPLQVEESGFSKEDVQGMSDYYFFDHPNIGAKSFTVELRNMNSATLVVSEVQYAQMKSKGLVYNLIAFNTPKITNKQFRMLYSNTALHNYVGVKTNGKMAVQLMNAEMQSPLLFSFIVLFFQILFYITILILYRLNEMIQKQYSIFRTLHIVGAKNTTIFGSVMLQTLITLLLPVGLSYCIAWIGISGVFHTLLTQTEIFNHTVKYLPHIVFIFSAISIVFTVYQANVIKSKQLS